ncbi:unnamed protein product [Schistosoma margrebowiei]|uniref:Uncharacterized protein n=1 Tax=Schistosoma margrebowiei TaxID=48269 RepID=A0A183LBB1_9TREM|nr:unnamed protein product [Schistosoma margrebowiei]
MVVGGSRQETLNPDFVLLDIRQQGVPVILRELMLSGGFDPVHSLLVIHLSKYHLYNKLFVRNLENQQTNQPTKQTSKQTVKAEINLSKSKLNTETMNQITHFLTTLTCQQIFPSMINITFIHM